MQTKLNPQPILNRYPLAEAIPTVIEYKGRSIFEVEVVGRCSDESAHPQSRFCPKGNESLVLKISIEESSFGSSSPLKQLYIRMMSLLTILDALSRDIFFLIRSKLLDSVIVDNEPRHSPMPRIYHWAGFLFQDRAWCF